MKVNKESLEILESKLQELTEEGMKLEKDEN